MTRVQRISLSRLLVAALVLLLAVHPFVAESQDSNSSGADDANPHHSVVKLFIRKANGAFVPAGSGFFVASHVIVTAADEARTNKPVFAFAVGSWTLHELEAMPVSASDEIELYRIPGFSGAPLPLARALPRVDQPVTVLGSSIRTPKQSEGRILTVPLGAAPLIGTSARVTAPNIGGAVVDRAGTVVGVATGRHSIDWETTYIVPAVAVARSLAGEPAPPNGNRINPDPKLLPPAPIGDPVGAEPAAGARENASTTGTRRSAVGVTKARVLNSPQPNYTVAARRNGTQGNVLVKTLLGADSRIKRTEILKGLPDELNRKAIGAIYQLKFIPAKAADGTPIDSWLTVSVNFSVPQPRLFGIWVGREDGAARRHIQFHFEYVDEETGRLGGFLILEVGSGSFALVPVMGKASGDRVRLDVPAGKGGPKYSWALEVAEMTLVGEYLIEPPGGEKRSLLRVRADRQDWLGDGEVREWHSEKSRTESSP